RRQLVVSFVAEILMYAIEKVAGRQNAAGADQAIHLETDRREGHEIDGEQAAEEKPAGENFGAPLHHAADEDSRERGHAAAMPGDKPVGRLACGRESGNRAIGLLTPAMAGHVAQRAEDGLRTRRNPSRRFDEVNGLFETLDGDFREPNGGGLVRLVAD